MKRRQLNKKIILVILILFISIGFAYLTSNLSINGLATIKKSVWDVHFEDITNENENVLTINNPAVISDNKLKIDFEVTLDQPGQEYSFYVDVVNKSTFDVMINNVALTGLTSEQEKWIKNTVTYSDGISIQKYDVLKENSLEVLRVSVKYLDDLTSSDLPTTDSDFSLTLEITFNQKDENAKERNHLEYITRQEEGKVSIGDEIAVGTEHFYVVSSNEENTVLLAKYNLKLGYNYSFDNITKSYTYSSADEGYGLQDENMLGYIGPGKEAKGTINFSNSKYWYNDGIIDKYKKNIYPEYIYDNSYDLPDGKNYSLAYYIKMYIEKLNVIGINNIKGRLLTREEAIELGCSKEEKTCTSSPYPFIYQTSFWLGTSNQNYEDKSYVYTIFNTSFRGNDSNDAWYFGLRPVIEVPTNIFS